MTKPAKLDENSVRGALRGLGAVTLLALGLAAFTPLPNLIHHRLVSSAQIAPADAVVVLSSSVDPSGRLSDGSLRRAIEGIRQVRRGTAPLLVLAGITRGGASEAQARATLAADLGIDGDRLVLVSGVHTTAEEANRVAAVLQPHGLSRVVLVTGGLHMRRARRVFEKAGFVVHPATVEDVSGDEVQPLDRVSLMRTVLQEAAARAYYRLKGAL